MKALGIFLIASLLFVVGCKGNNQGLPEYGYIKNNNTIVSSAVTGQVGQRAGKATSSSILATLNKGVKVKLISRTSNRLRVGGDEDFWYKVEYASGKTGYIFGKNLAFTASN